MNEQKGHGLFLAIVNKIVMTLVNIQVFSYSSFILLSNNKIYKKESFT